VPCRLGEADPEEFLDCSADLPQVRRRNAVAGVYRRGGGDPQDSESPGFVWRSWLQVVMYISLYAGKKLLGWFSVLLEISSYPPKLR